MAKITGKDGIILIGGYSLSAQFSNYEASKAVQSIDVTGFGEGNTNYIPGMATAEMTLNGYWDNTANGINDALKSLGTKVATVLPEGYPALGSPSLSINAMQESWTPAAGVDAAITIGSVKFMASGAGYGLYDGWALQHGTITNTTTGTGFDDPTGGAVTAACAGIIHIWTPCATDTYQVKIQHSTTLGSGYADLITFTVNGSARASEVVQVASGTVNRYRRIVATRTGAAGNTFGFTVCFWHS